jgi:hypothetical protein
MKEEEIGGHKISYEEGRSTLELGIKYLKKLDASEVKTLFFAAKHNDYNGEAHFRDCRDNRFELDYKGSGEYELRYRD